MEIDYKKAFEKLVYQIKTEHGWAVESMESHNKFSEEFEYDDYRLFRKAYDRGMVFAYGSMKELAEQLEKGEKFW